VASAKNPFGCMVGNVNKYVGRTFEAAFFACGRKSREIRCNCIDCRVSPPVNDVKIKKLTYNR
jgi:hypothetical protein